MKGKVEEKKAPGHAPETDTPPEDEYFELRIPRFTRGRVPFPVFLCFVIIAFCLGMLTMRLFYGTASPQMAAVDATDAFKSLAKKAHLNTGQFNSCLDSSKYASTVKSEMDAGTALTVSATPTFFINGRMLVGAQPYSVFKQMIDQELSGQATKVDAEEASPSARKRVAKGHLPLLGNTKAKVVITEFSDFQCPFCEAFFKDSLSQLKKEYIDTGKVQLTYRDFPLTSIHPNAEMATEAAECANEQGKFWDYHNLLFETQDSWANLPLTAPTGTI